MCCWGTSRSRAAIENRVLAFLSAPPKTEIGNFARLSILALALSKQSNPTYNEKVSYRFAQVARAMLASNCASSVMGRSHSSCPFAYWRKMSTVHRKGYHLAVSAFMRVLARHWYALFLTVYGIWVFTPFLAPVFMRFGASEAGKIVYDIYALFCHQLPQRSFFLFGEKTMYSLDEIQRVWHNAINPVVLRQFIGNEVMGWKVAWSDRMIALYTSIWFFGLLWYPLRWKMKPLPWRGFFSLLMPMAFDGGSHAISDLAGLGQGFRDTNEWLRILTNNVFSTTFYAGDALGSFNSLMRLITAILAGLAIVWLTFPSLFQVQVGNRCQERGG